MALHEDGLDNIARDLSKALNLMDGRWARQNDRQDRLTQFVYRVSSLDELLSECRRTGTDTNYALHRWYNFITSKAAEKAFCEAGAIPEANERHHDIDIWLDGTPYDVKLTVYPRTLSHRPYDIAKLSGKDAMIRWLYENQSQQGRKELTNRLYVMIDETNPTRAYAGKANLQGIRKQAQAFVQWTREHGQRQVLISDGARSILVFADLVRVPAA